MQRIWNVINGSGEEGYEEEEQEQQWKKRGKDNAAATILLHNRYVQVMLVGMQ